MIFLYYYSLSQCNINTETYGNPKLPLSSAFMENLIKFIKGSLK